MNIEPAPNSPEPADAEISALVQRLKRTYGKATHPLVARLIEYGEPGIAALFAVLDTITKQSQFVQGLSSVLIVTACLLTHLLVQPEYKAWARLPIYLLMVCVVVMETLQSPKREALRLLALADNFQSVSGLTELLTQKQLKYLLMARGALTRILPRMKESDAEYLPLKSRNILLKQFDVRQSKSEFLLAIIKAMEQVGGAEAVPVVSRLAAGKGRAAKDSALKQAAIECLPYLTARAQGKELRDTLLRSSSAASAAPETLMRPATSPNEEPPEELLRPM